ncbi:MAG: type 2 isopentenyl-diphosphate Delta-isomerase [Chloroflexi bacterium]|nr:type 2 isopentenyl-diphosphate Delta-isomerase [Chloroflexota bacterium]MBP8055753.1 type 2 isopentenyl-diphosphate Delta-isomerase [Chloroflexota bacterium]
MASLTAENRHRDSNESPEVLERRKADHIRINLEEDVSFQLTTGLEKVHFMHQALPELNLAEIKTQTTVFGKPLNTPLLISSMTGGTAEAQKINRTLAEAAQQVGMAMGLGSQRAAVADASLAYTYHVRDVAPDILLFANLGAVQFNYGYGLAECQRAVEMCQADALILHFNVLQEAVQPEGDSNFANLLPKIAQVCQQLSIPVIAKEVGWGFSAQAARQLIEAGISAIDVAGAGGTSWSQVEMHRAPTAKHARIAAAFRDWGIPTASSIQFCRQASPDLPVFASGGLKNGIDIAKCIALGANLGGLAGEFLRAAVKGTSAVIELADTITTELKIAMLCVGAKDLTALGHTPLYTTI